MHTDRTWLALSAEEDVWLAGVEVSFKDEFVADVDEVLHYVGSLSSRSSVPSCQSTVQDGQRTPRGVSVDHLRTFDATCFARSKVLAVLTAS